MTRTTNNTVNRGPVPHKILSDRGIHLERCRIQAENSNLMHGMTAFSFLDDNNQSIEVKIGQKCPICKNRVRGLNHENGDHHKGISIRRGR